ncbi:hypothetical protein [Egicoccus halophilus]|uniref:Uncharacterized protein n=1 Tax=Egicoccus halophilus TaxID=1670830 RepID=A0A8J3AHQ6_9ACTN|nr:hypothetical protein [Egicoccus halophilus]GGI08919.1 hypothetical protein GCM10011354_31490 [Egicoccus halophilus]
MVRGRGPAGRLLIAPVVFLIVLVVGLQLLDTTVARTPDPALDLRAGLPAEAGEVVRCEREQLDTLPAEQLAERFDPDGRVTSAMVTACPAAFDGRRVTYAGELVGDLLRRDGGAWVQVNDDDYALVTGPLGSHTERRGGNQGLAVWLPDDLPDGLVAGRADRRGDVVLVTGVVHRQDPADGGGLSVRADRLEVLAPATDVELAVDPGQAVLAGVAIAAAAAIWLLRRRQGP